MKLENLRVGFRLALVFTSTTLLSMLFGVVAWVQVSRIGEGADDIAGNWLPSVQAIDDLQVRANRLRRTESELFLPAEQSESASYEAQLRVRREAMDKAEKIYGPLVTEGKERMLFTTYEGQRAAYLATQDKMLAMLAAHAPHADITRVFFHDSMAQFDGMTATLGEAGTFNRDSADEARRTVTSLMSKARDLLVGLGSVFLALSALLGWWIVRLIPLSSARAVTNAGENAAIVNSRDHDLPRYHGQPVFSPPNIP